MTWTVRGDGFGALQVYPGLEMLIWWGDGHTRAVWHWNGKAAAWIDGGDA